VKIRALDELTAFEAGSGPDEGDGVWARANGFLDHLGTRNFAAATQRAYAYDLLNFAETIARSRCVRSAPISTSTSAGVAGDTRRRPGAGGAGVLYPITDPAASVDEALALAARCAA
jgi:hypothetical protein